MSIYLIYKNKDKREDSSIVIIKQGFSAWALIFGFFWAIYHRMWTLSAVICVVFYVFLPYIQDKFPTLTCFTSTTLSVCLGIFASDIREYHEIKSGAVLDDIIFANSYEEAEIKFYVRDLAQNS